MKIQLIIDYLITYSSFWVSWLFLGAIAIAISGFLTRGMKPQELGASLQEKDKQAIEAQKYRLSHSKPASAKLIDSFAVVLMSLFILLYIYLIYYKADFAYSDNSQFTFYSLRDRFFGMPIWTASGRFFPLGLQEYNLISLVSKTVYAYHGLSVLQLLAVVGSLFFVFKRCQVWIRCLITFAVLTIPSFTVAFFGLIYPERNIIFWLSIFLVCYQRWSQTGYRTYLFLLLTAAHFSLYYKEPIFLIFSGFAIFRIGLGLISHIRNKQSIKFKFLKTYAAEVGLLILSMGFLGLYLGKFLPYLGQAERNQEELSWSATLLGYLGSNFLILSLIVVYLLRCLFLIATRRSFDRFWDAIGLGAIFYFLAFVKLGLFNNYYLAPADFLAILYFGNLISQLLLRTAQSDLVKRFIPLAAVGLCAILVIPQNLDQSATHLLYRKNTIAGKVQLQASLERYGDSQSDGSPTNLYFPFPESGFSLMEFSSFLEYKGLKLVKDPTQTVSDEPLFLVESPEEFEDSLCVEYGRPHKCFYAEAAEQNDLIVILPSRQPVSGVDLAEVEAEAELVFHYIPQLSWIEKGLLLLSREYGRPLDWLNAYIFQKQG